MRYTAAEHDAFAHDFNRDSICILRNHLPRETLQAWRRAFQPLLEAQIEAQRDDPNRGAQRFYVTLPFQAPFADPAIYEDPDILAIVERVAGPQPLMCQLATDTPLRGSDYQDWHADTPALFPETGSNDTPSFQIAVNFPLCDVNDDNGPFETTHGTHRMDKEQVLAGIQAGTVARHRVKMALGDVMIRDVRAVHRGTPNTTDEPRPMVVIGYSRRWLFRPEVSIRVPQAEWEHLSPTGRQLLRGNRVLAASEALPGSETYRAFAF